MVKAREIFLIGVLFFAGFLISEFLVDRMMFDNPLQRFGARVIFQAEFYLIIYLLFALRDIGRRLRLIETLYSREKRLLPQNRRLNMKRRIIKRGDYYGKNRRS